MRLTLLESDRSFFRSAEYATVSIVTHVAVVWFVLGLMADRIFFYPPILFVVGLVAFIKGLVGGGDDDE